MAPDGNDQELGKELSIFHLLGAEVFDSESFFSDDFEISADSAGFYQRLYPRWGKRCLDLFFAVLLLPLILPVLAILALLLLLEGGKPFFGQARVGRGGRPFHCWKLRTMVPDAEARLRALLESDQTIQQEWDAHQKLRDDPRITPLGSFLRKSSLDELPQIFNVLKGEMSLVGPRPFMLDQQEAYDAEGGRKYYLLRPGITGPWQVTERNDSVFSTRVLYDERYANSVSLAADLRIILATCVVVLRNTGH